MKKNKLKYFIPIIVIVGLIFIFLNSYFQTKKECESSYNFVITKIKETPTKQWTFFNEDKEVELWGFIVSSKEDIKAGDILYKPVCSAYIQILRKDRNGRDIVISEANYTGMFPYEWFCD